MHHVEFFTPSLLPQEIQESTNIISFAFIAARCTYVLKRVVRTPSSSFALIFTCMSFQAYNATHDWYEISPLINARKTTTYMLTC